MQHEAKDIAGETTQTDPPQERSGWALPERIAGILRTVRTLLGYGRHMVETVKHRAEAPNFPGIAVNFGTSRLASILAHLQRGILRAMALEHVLLARAERGKTIQIVQRSVRAAKPEAAPADPQGDAAGDPPAVAAGGQAEPSSGHDVAKRKPARLSRPNGWDDPELFMPTLEDLIAQVRRRPLGRTVVDICLDLAVMPGICRGDLWNDLHALIHFLGGSLPTLIQERMRREREFEKEQDRRPTSAWKWWDLKRDETRAVLGFFVGEEPVDPFGLRPGRGTLTPAVATGPP
jgi:hypothetical protein